MAAIQPPPPQGSRLHWEQAPRRLRVAFEAWAGSPVREAVTQPSGFSPGVAARLLLANGRRVFVKAVGPDLNADSAGIHRRELRIISEMPDDVPAPTLLWSHDEGEGGWVALAFEDIEGQHPRQPWDLRELERVLGALVRLGKRLTPSPLPPGTAWSAAQAFPQTGWRVLRDEEGHRPRSLAPWFRDNLGWLARLEAGVPEAVEGDTLLHMDVRADNLLLTPERVWFLDWPHAVVGAAWVDVVVMAPSVTMQGGPSSRGGRRCPPRLPHGRPRAGHRGHRGHGRGLHGVGLATAPARPSHLARLPGSAGHGRARLAQAAAGRTLVLALAQPPGDALAGLRRVLKGDRLAAQHRVHREDRRVVRDHRRLHVRT